MDTLTLVQRSVEYSGRWRAYLEEDRENLGTEEG